MDDVFAAKVRALADKEAIRDCLMRYCRAIDRCDADLLRSVYWPEATDDHAIWKGSGSEFVDWVIPLVREGFNVTQHLIGNVLIELQGDLARVESYFQAFHNLRLPDGNSTSVLLGGRYLDRMEHRNDEWRISDRLVVFDWYHDLGAGKPWEAGPFGMPANVSALKPDDLVYRAW